MTPEQIEQIRPRLVEFTAQMLTGAVGRSDQRVKGELYVRGLLTEGARKSMQPMAARLGVDHQQLQQFVTSSTWDYSTVRANVARWAVQAIAPAGYVIDDSGFPKDGTASPCVARQYSGTLGKTANCQIGVSVQLATDTASAAADWRLFCPASWDDTTISDPDKATAVRAKRDRAGIGEDVRHREKWRLALDMLDEMLNEWGLPRLPVAADSGYGDCTLFRLGLAERGLRYAVQVDPTAIAYPADAVPVTPSYAGRGRPPRPTYADPPVTFKDLALAAGPRQRTPGDLAAGQPAHEGKPGRGDALTLPAPAHPPGQPRHPPQQRRQPARRLADRRMATRRRRTGQILAVQPRRPCLAEEPGPVGEAAVAGRTRLPRTQDRSRDRPLRGPFVHRLAPTRHPHRPRPSLLHPAAPRPKSGCAGLTLYAVLRELQQLLTVMAGACHTCNRPYHDTT